MQNLLIRLIMVWRYKHVTTKGGSTTVEVMVHTIQEYFKVEATFYIHNETPAVVNILLYSVA